MLNGEQIRSLIAVRVEELYKVINRGQRICLERQIRDLIWVLNGKDSGHLHDALDILDVAGIPYIRIDEESFEWEDGWLASHGFEVEHGDIPEDDVISHPEFGH